MIKRKPKPSEQAMESLSTTKELAFRRRLSGVVCKPPCGARVGNCPCAERQGKTRTKSEEYQKRNIRRVMIFWGSLFAHNGAK